MGSYLHVKHGRRKRMVHSTPRFQLIVPNIVTFANAFPAINLVRLNNFARLDYNRPPIVSVILFMMGVGYITCIMG